MFWTAAAGLFCAILLLDAAAGRFDLFARTRAHLDSTYGDSARQIAICEHLSRTLARTDQAGCNESLSRRFRTRRQTLLEIAQTNDLVLDPKDIGETALWQPSRERHLAALELRLSTAGTVMAGACLDSLVSLSGSLTRARARSAAEPLAVTMRSGSRNEVVKPESGHLLCGLCLLCGLFLTSRHFDQSSNLVTSTK